LAVQGRSLAAHFGNSPHIRVTTEDLLVDLSENASIGAEGGGYIFALDEEAYGANEEAIELVWVDKLL
jgi:hypothetical protein